MALFKRKREGDTGVTYLKMSGEKRRISKSSVILETMGSLEEAVAFLGVCKVKARDEGIYVGTEYPSLEHIITELQDDLHVIQKEISGKGEGVPKERISWLEDIMKAIEREKVSGDVIETELGTLLNTAQTFVRRAERRVVELREPINPSTGKMKEEWRKVGETSLACINRLSDVLEALARLSNHVFGIKESAPLDE